MMHDDENRSTNGEFQSSDEYKPPAMTQFIMCIVLVAYLISFGFAISRMTFASTVIVCLALPLTSPLFYIFGKMIISEKYWDDSEAKKKRMWSLENGAIWLITFPTLMLFLIGSINISLLDSSGLWESVALFTAAITAVGTLLLYLCYYKDVKQTLKASLVVAIFALTYTWGGLVASNAAFDTHPTEQRFGIITGQRIVTSVQPSSTYNLNIDLINGTSLRSHSVNRNFFNSVEVGEVIRVCTRPGFFGLEWVSCVHGVDPAMQPMLQLVFDNLDSDAWELMQEFLQS